MFFEQTTIRHQPLDIIRYRRWVLVRTIAHPYLQNTEIFFRRNRNPRHGTDKGIIHTNRIPHHQICQVFPDFVHRLVCHLVRKAPSMAILWVLPHWLDSLTHEKQHAVFHQRIRERLHYRQNFLHLAERIHLLVRSQTPVCIMWKVRPKTPGMRKRMEHRRVRRRWR